MKAMHILVGESNAAIRSTIHQLLDDDGRFQALVDAADGETAVAGAAQADAAVIDLTIAGLGCLATISRIRHHPRSPAVMALTPTDDRHLMNAARDAGAEDVLVWPRDLHLLADHLADIGSRQP